MTDKYVIVDIDGTLADGSHRNHLARAKKWQQYFAEMGEDTLRSEVVKLIKNSFPDMPWVIVTGRPADYRQVTESWLKKYGIEYIALYTRGKKDFRPDYIVKQEILDNKLNKDSIVAVIDDRPQVIRMWRKNGLNVIDVGDGEEF